MNWTVFDRSYVLAALPLVRRPYIESFIETVEGFSAKVDEVIANTRADFRVALAQAGNDLDPDETKLPNPCLRYAYYIVEYEIARMVDGFVPTPGGVEYRWNPEISPLIRAEVYQRAIYETRMNLAATAAASPSYGPPANAEERSLP
jgi:hypothetical protein